MALANELPRQRWQPNVVAQAGLWGGTLMVGLVLVLGLLLLNSAPSFHSDVRLPNETRLSLGILEACPAEVSTDICEPYRLHMKCHFELALNEPGVRHVLMTFDLPPRER